MKKLTALALWFFAIGNVQSEEKILPTGDGFGIRAMAISRDGNYCLTGHGTSSSISNRGHVLIWDLKNATQIAKIDRLAEIDAVAFSPDGKTIVVHGTADRLRLLDFDSKKVVRTLWEAGSAAAFSPDGKHLVTSENGKESLMIWDLSLAKPEAKRLEHKGVVHSIVMDWDRKRMATVTDNRVLIWDTSTWKKTGELRKSRGIIRFSPANPDLIFISDSLQERDGRRSVIFDFEQGEVVAKLERRDSVSDAAFSADGKWLFTVTGWSLEAWDVKTGKNVSRRLTKAVYSVKIDAVASWQKDSVIYGDREKNGRTMIRIVPIDELLKNPEWGNEPADAK